MLSRNDQIKTEQERQYRLAQNALIDEFTESKQKELHQALLAKYAVSVTTSSMAQGKTRNRKGQNSIVMGKSKKEFYAIDQDHYLKLILKAAELGQIEALQFIIDVRKKKDNESRISPKVMKAYLEIIYRQHQKIVKNSLLTNSLLAFDPVNKTLSDNYNEIALIMFKEYLHHEIFKREIKSVDAILNDIDKYLPRGSLQYQQFMDFAKTKIMVFGTGEMVKNADGYFHYSTDADLTNKINEGYGGREVKEYYMDLPKENFIKQAGSVIDLEKNASEDTASIISKKYEGIILSVLEKIKKLNDENQQKASGFTSFLFSRSRAQSTSELLIKIEACTNDHSLDSIGKTLVMADLIKNTYNEICDQVHATKSQKNSSTAQELLLILNEICLKSATSDLYQINGVNHSLQALSLTPDEASHNSKYRINKVKLEQSLVLKAEQRISERFAPKATQSP